jgi:hypothetical protein
MFCSNEVRFKLTIMIQNIITYNVLQISEGTNSVGIVRGNLGFCLCAVMRGAFNKLKLEL